MQFANNKDPDEATHHLQCPRYSGPLTPIIPTTTRQREIFTFYYVLQAPSLRVTKRKNFLIQNKS